MTSAQWAAVLWFLQAVFWAITISRFPARPDDGALRWLPYFACASALAAGIRSLW